MIEKLIHHVWIGNNEPSEFLKACRESVIKLHPEWVFNTWYFRTDRDSGIGNNDDFERVFNHPKLKPLTEGRDFARFNKRIESYKGRHSVDTIKSDFIRCCLLYIYGGFYLDWDVYGIRPLDDFCCDNLVLARIKEGLVAEALIGAPAGNEHIGRIITDYVDRIKPEQGYCSLRLAEYSEAHSLYCYPSDYFIPHQRLEGTEKAIYRTTDNTRTIHCWRQTIYDLKRLEAIASKASSATEAKSQPASIVYPDNADDNWEVEWQRMEQLVKDNNEK